MNPLPFLIDAVPTWTCTQDYASGSVAVETGIMQCVRIPSGGKLKMNHSAKALVTASRPEEAEVQGETTVRMKLPLMDEVEVKTRSLISQTGMLLTGRITVKDQLLFEKIWQ
jgi:hypothetical protein